MVDATRGSGARLIGGTGRSERPDDDHYSTPEEATRAFMRAERVFFAVPVWEPCCGSGAMARVIGEKFQVYASNLVDYGYGVTGIDFLQQGDMPSGVINIVTNPPYKIASEIIRHGHNLLKRAGQAGSMALLLPSRMLHGQARSKILQDCGLRRVYFFRKRITMKPDNVVLKNGSTIDYAWFVFEPGARFHDFSGKWLDV